MFTEFKLAVQKQFEAMTQHDLFVVDVDKDELWGTYMEAWPAGTNEIYKERREHDCNCCRHFIRDVGAVVAVVDGEIATVWDGEMDEPYSTVAAALSQFVRSKPIRNIFLSEMLSAGVDKNRQLLESGDVITWEHFHVKIPRKFVVSSDKIGPRLAEARSTYDVFTRALREITVDAVATVLDLIDQGSLYRGDEFRKAVADFQLQLRADRMDPFGGPENLWALSRSLPQSTTRIRNTVIGSLLVDLSEGRDLESAVASYEAKVAPTNYKRPTALITKSMIASAQKKVEELGFASALQRRYAVAEDLTINNVLFADRQAKAAMNVFDELAEATPVNEKTFSKVEEVPIEKFLVDILPKANSVELFVENKHCGNFFSLVAPVDPDSKCMFKWPNNFSWSYVGELTDSIKERVKKAGGNVEGDFRCSLSWFNRDDLDLHMIEPDRHEIYYGDKRSYRTKGQLDVDMNYRTIVRDPVENIFYTRRESMLEGQYLLFVHNYNRRETTDVGFEVEMDYMGSTQTFSYKNAVPMGEQIVVAEFKYTHKGGIELINSLPSTAISKETWGVKTQQFQKVRMVLNSPNHWDGLTIGNKHYFFVLDGCLNPDATRGFYNEFLTDELRENRKVFEVLGSRMKTEPSDTQLSGLGFSSTKRAEAYCRLTGAFTRTIKLVF